MSSLGVRGERCEYGVGGGIPPQQWVQFPVYLLQITIRRRLHHQEPCGGRLWAAPAPAQAGAGDPALARARAIAGLLNTIKRLHDEPRSPA